MKFFSILGFFASTLLVCGICNVFAESNGQFAYEGLIEPSEVIDIGTPVAGVVESIKVERSSFVEKGTPLVLLDSSVEKAVVAKAQAMVLAESGIKLEEERLSFAQLLLARVDELFRNQVISEEKLDKAKTEVKLARCRLDKAREDKIQAKLDLARAKALLNQRTIKSPVAGIIVEKYVSPGEFVREKPLLTLAQVNPLRVEVVLPAEMLRQIKPGMTAQISPELEPEKKYTATVTIVDRM
ncbi:MAG: efflux RND transporter periplasmic adaptor subunit, partial [Desulfobacterales bacterium]|nr:efflux RND transporter periplasmic adaptor subunit [Desulfobacterales bacterium]